jgi:hypothetical protein
MPHKKFALHPFHIVLTWTVHLGFPVLGRIKINKTIDEGKNWDFEQKQVSPDLPILGSFHSMGYMEFSQICNLVVKTGKNWFLKKEKPFILFSTTAKINELRNSSFASCKTFTVDTQTLVVYSQ